MQGEEQECERHDHHHQRHEDGGMNGRSAEPQHRRGLMERVPPLDRKLDDRDIDRADEREHRDDPRRAARIFDGAPERDDAEIHQEQHQHRREPRIPDPIGAPHRLAPERAGEQADQRETGADRRGSLLGDIGERMAPHQSAQRGNAHEHPRQAPEPGGRHVDEHDLHRGALLVVVGREVGLADRERKGHERGGRQPRQQPVDDDQEAGRIGEVGQRHRGCSGIPRTSDLGPILMCGRHRRQCGRSLTITSFQAVS